MSSISLYDASIPQFKNGLTALAQILAKAAEHYGDKSSDMLQANLIQDMLPLPGHVFLVSNIAKKSLTRMARIPTDVWPDDEDTVEKLISRCERTIRLLDTITPGEINGHEDDQVNWKLGPYELTMSSKEYLFRYAIPFFNFHLQLVYSILRMKGVDLGFSDFLRPNLEQYLVEKSTGSV